MLELTAKECEELELAVVKKLIPELTDDANDRLVSAIVQASAKTTIAVIQEYERMKAEKAAAQQSDL